MKVTFIFFTLIGFFMLTSQSWALDEAAAASSAESSANSASALSNEAGSPLFLTFAGPEAATVLLVAGTVLLSSAGTLYAWSQREARIRYSDAANEAKLRLAKDDKFPITSSLQESEQNHRQSNLVAVANLERQTAHQQGINVNQMDERDLAKVIVVRSARFNQQPE